MPPFSNSPESFLDQEISSNFFFTRFNEDSTLYSRENSVTPQDWEESDEYENQFVKPTIDLFSWQMFCETIRHIPLPFVFLGVFFGMMSLWVHWMTLMSFPVPVILICLGMFYLFLFLYLICIFHEFQQKIHE